MTRILCLAVAYYQRKYAPLFRHLLRAGLSFDLLEQLALVIFLYTNQRFIFLISCLALLATGLAQAVQVNNLYSASVPIASQQTSDRSQGFDQALLQVVVKITGNRDLLLQDHLVQSLLPGESYVQTFSYRENPEFHAFQDALEEQKLAQENQAQNDDSQTLIEPLSADEVQAEGERVPLVPEPFLMDVSFSETGIKEKLTSLNIPIWGKTRPSVLLWLVTESKGERVLMGDGMFEGQKTLEDVAYHSGVPLFLPVADLADANAFDISDLWALFPGTVEEASDRYRADASVMMRLYQREGGYWSADWTLQHGNMIESHESSHLDLSVILKDMVAHIAKSFADRYAVLRSETVDSSGLNIVISNVNSFEDYVLVQRYLTNLPPVAEARLDWLNASEQAYHLVLNGTQDQFFEHLELGQRLIREPVSAVPEETPLVTVTDLAVPIMNEAEQEFDEPDFFDQQLEAIFNEPVIRLVWQGNK